MASSCFILATGNPHKAAEIQQILGSHHAYMDLRTFPDCPEAVEDGETFLANATKKLIHLTRYLLENDRLASCLPQERGPVYVLADDSGLEVRTLAWAPGVYSARFAGLDGAAPGNSSDSLNNEKLLRLMATVPDSQRQARFRCVLAWTQIRKRGDELLPQRVDFAKSLSSCEGFCMGRIASKPEGAGGFGYDPLFIPDGYTTPLAALGEALKNQMSHRARALAELRRRLELGV